MDHKSIYFGPKSPDFKKLFSPKEKRPQRLKKSVVFFYHKYFTGYDLAAPLIT
jgi:hypothetical protein